MRDEYGARHDFVSSSCTSEKKGNERRRRAWWRPGRKHLFSLLRDGSSGRDHSSPSSLTASVITRMSSSSALSLALREADDSKRAGSVTEPDNTSASEAARERLSSSSLSLTPNKIMSLAATGGRWSCWVKRTAECSLCADGEARCHWASVSSLGTGFSNPLPRCFFLTGPWEKEKGRARGTESLSEKKAIRERGEARLGVSVGFPQAWHTLSVSVSRVQGRPGAPRRCICNNAVKFALLVRLFRLTSDSCRGWPSLQAGCCEVLIRLLEAFQRRIPASAKSQRRREFVTEEKKSEMRWQAADYKDRCPSHFGRLWSGCIAIGSLATTVDWFGSFTLYEPITCSYNCVIEKGFSEGEKRDFPILTSISRRSMSEISKGNFGIHLQRFYNSLINCICSQNEEDFRGNAKQFNYMLSFHLIFI